MSGSTASRRRIRMVAPEPFFRATGTPMNVLLMCRALTESGFGIHLLTLPRGDDIALPGLVLHRVAPLPGINAVGFSRAKLLYNLVVAVEMRRLRRRPSFGLVHAVEEAVFYAAWFARWCDTSAVTDRAARRRAIARHTFAIFKGQLLSASQTILGDGDPEAAAVATGGAQIHG